MTASKKERMVKRSIPWSLHMAIVRLQGEEELDYREACARAAVLIEVNGSEFEVAVRVEANRLYKSRFLGEVNKAKNTWMRKGYDDGKRDGKAEGFLIASEDFLIRYPCSACGLDVILRPGNPDTEAAVEFLKSRGWGHPGCMGASSA